MKQADQVRQLTGALEPLLATTDLNLEALEPETIAAIERASEVLETVQYGLTRFRVRYARLVVIETEVLAEHDGEIAAMPLPGVFEGIPSDQLPAHVTSIEDYDHLWEIEPAQGSTSTSLTERV